MHPEVLLLMSLEIIRTYSLLASGEGVVYTLASSSLSSMYLPYPLSPIIRSLSIISCAFSSSCSGTGKEKNSRVRYSSGTWLSTALAAHPSRDCVPTSCALPVLQSLSHSFSAYCSLPDACCICGSPTTDTWSATGPKDEKGDRSLFHLFRL